MNNLDKHFDYILQDIRQKRTLILILALTDPQILLNAKFSQQDVDKLVVIGKEKILRQKLLRDIYLKNRDELPWVELINNTVFNFDYNDKHGYEILLYKDDKLLNILRWVAVS